MGKDTMNTRKLIEERRQKKQRQSQLMILMMVGGVVLVIAAVVLSVISSSRVNLPERQIEIPEFTSLPADFNGLGDPNAPVVIEEFSDFGCSHCADFALETKKLIEDEYIKSGQVYLVFHSVGELLGSPATFQAAEAAYCAADQEAMWPYHDLIFANQVKLFPNRSADLTPSLISFAELLELDVDQFSSCLKEGKYTNLVAEDMDLAIGYGISGTPAFLINGTLVRGNQPYATFQNAINQALEANSP
jgi:protein-disulfide isomerase